MLEINESDFFYLKDSVVLKNILGKTYFALDCDSGSQYDLSEMEYEILGLISNKKSFGEILAHVLSNYAVDVVVAKSDLTEYFLSLMEAGLVKKGED